MSEHERQTLLRVRLINEILNEYAMGDDEKILASELMPEFIKKGVFERDRNNGYPIRCFLVELLSEGRLSLIPFAKLSGSKWYFVFYSTSKYDRQNPDEKYVIDLCDRVIMEQGLRQHRFEFLKGSRCLPVDVYYPRYSLVIEYLEEYHYAQKFGGIKNYDEHRRTVLKQNNMTLLEIEFLDFAYDSKYRIIRRENKDIQVVEKRIKEKVLLSS